MVAADSLVLALNAGSSSLKYKVYQRQAGSEQLHVILSGSCKDITADEPHYSIKKTGQHSPTTSKVEATGSYEKVVHEIVAAITDAVKDDGEVHIAAHRIVHGGGQDNVAVIEHGSKEEKEVLEKMDKISSFAPLHNYHAMLAVRECLATLGESSISVLAFDTLFHTTIPAYRTTYPVSKPPHETPIPLRKYGFHGLSYYSILSNFSKWAGKAPEDVNLVVCHLGSGASACLIQGGKSVKTTMGLTPLEGLPGGTRSGTVDPSLIFHHTPDCSDDTESGVSKGELVLNKESGFKALTGLSDFGEITTKAEQGDEHAKLCYDLFLDRVKSVVHEYVGTLLATGAKLHGVVFSGGIGENSSSLRRDVMDSLFWLERLHGAVGGVIPAANETLSGTGPVFEITREQSAVRGFVVETDEEMVCAQLALTALA